jgi:hypothetical protein
MEETMSELLPCPRCGGAARLDNYQRSDDFCPTVHCPCGLSFRLTDNYCEADTAKTVAAWNTRPVSATAVEVTEEQVEAAIAAFMKITSTVNDEYGERYVCGKRAMRAALAAGLGKK